MKKEKVEKIRDRIAGNPPILLVRLKDNTPFYIPIRLVEPLRYGSWEGSEVNIDTDSSLKIIKIKPELEISEECFSYFNMAKQEYYKKLRALNFAKYMMKRSATPITFQWLTDPEIELHVEIYNATKIFSISHRSLYVRFFNTCFGKFIYTFLMIFGYSIILDDIFILLAKYEKIRVKRKISHDGSLKCPAFKADPQFSQEEYNSQSFNYLQIYETSPAYYQCLNAELQKCQYNNQYSFAQPVVYPGGQPGYGYPPQEGIPPQQPGYAYPPQQGVYPPQQGYPQPDYPQQEYQNQQQFYGVPNPPTPQQPPEETKGDEV